MTSLLLTVIVGEKEAIGYYLTFRSFGTMAKPNSMGVRKCRDHFQAIRSLEYSHSSLHHWDLSDLRPLLYREDFPSFHLNYARHDHWSIVDVYHHLIWWFVRFSWLSSENTSLTGHGENLSSSHPTSRSDSDAGNPSRFTIPFGELARRRV